MDGTCLLDCLPALEKRLLRCYIPAAFDYLNPGGPPSIVLVVSPLTAIMKDQASANSA